MLLNVFSSLSLLLNFFSCFFKLLIVYSCLSMLLHFFSCHSMLFNFFSCLSMLLNLFSCLSMLLNILSCLSVLINAFSCLSLAPKVYSCHYCHLFCFLIPHFSRYLTLSLHVFYLSNVCVHYCYVSVCLPAVVERTQHGKPDCISCDSELTAIKLIKLKHASEGLSFL